MTPTQATSVADVIRAMETLAPLQTAEDWDNPGLQVGDPSAPVRLIWTALDPLPGVVGAALEAGAGMLVVHHPLIFSPLKSVDLATPLGRVLAHAVAGGLAVFAAHTNLDRAAGGVNDVLADRLGLSNRKPLAPSPAPDVPGLGLVGRLSASVPLSEFAGRVRDALGLASVRFAGDPGLLVSRVAVCGGSGRGLIRDFMRSGAQAYVTGDLGYHDARTVESAGLGCVDAGHFATERLVVPVLAQKLGAALRAMGHDVPVVPCELERNPLHEI